MSKHHYGRDLWDSMCEFVSEPDDLLTYDFGPWTLDKLYFLGHYLGITTHAMVGHKSFSSVNYIDLFCGPGVAALKHESSSRRYPGSPLLAAGCPKSFNNLLLVDANEDAVKSTLSRIRKLSIQSNVKTWVGNSNDLIDEIVDHIPDRSLNIAFIDPYSLDLNFDTVRKLASNRPMDLLILFADAMDIVRNVDRYYYPDHDSKLDKFLGQNSNWRSQWDKLDNRSAVNVRSIFADIYLKQLQEIGYGHHKVRTFSGPKGPLYKLIYASKSDLGLKFWDIAESEGRDYQRSLF